MSEREKIVEKVLKKIDKLKKSRELDYLKEVVKVDKQISIEIECTRVEWDELDCLGEVITIDLYGLKNDDAVEGISNSDDYRKDVNYILDCMTNL